MPRWIWKHFSNFRQDALKRTRAVTADCDPRLNADQALELAFLRSERMKSGRDEKRMAVNG